MNRRIMIGQRLVAAFVLGVLLLTYPLLSLFNREQMLFGIPVLYIYIFVVWALLIGLFAFIVERRR